MNEDADERTFMFLHQLSTLLESYRMLKQRKRSFKENHADFLFFDFFRTLQRGALIVTLPAFFNFSPAPLVHLSCSPVSYHAHPHRKDWYFLHKPGDHQFPQP